MGVITTFIVISLRLIQSLTITKSFETLTATTALVSPFFYSADAFVELEVAEYSPFSYSAVLMILVQNGDT